MDSPGYVRGLPSGYCSGFPWTWQRVALDVAVGSPLAAWGSWFPCTWQRVPLVLAVGPSQSCRGSATHRSISVWPLPLTVDLSLQQRQCSRALARHRSPWSLGLKAASEGRQGKRSGSVVWLAQTQQEQGPFQQLQTTCTSRLTCTRSWQPHSLSGIAYHDPVTTPFLKRPANVSSAWPHRTRAAAPARKTAAPGALIPICFEVCADTPP